MFYLENLPDALWLLSFHFLPGSVCSVEIDAVQQRLASKIEVLRKDSAVARHAAPGPRHAAAEAAPGGDGYNGFTGQSGSGQQRDATQPFRGAYVPGGNEA